MLTVLVFMLHAIRDIFIIACLIILYILTYNVWNEIIKSFSKINNLEVSNPNPDPSETDMRKEAFIHRLLKNVEISKPEDVDFYLTPKNIIKLILLCLIARSCSEKSRYGLLIRTWRMRICIHYLSSQLKRTE